MPTKEPTYENEDLWTDPNWNAAEFYGIGSDGEKVNSRSNVFTAEAFHDFSKPAGKPPIKTDINLTNFRNTRHLQKTTQMNTTVTTPAVTEAMKKKYFSEDQVFFNAVFTDHAFTYKANLVAAANEDWGAHNAENERTEGPPDGIVRWGNDVINRHLYSVNCGPFKSASHKQRVLRQLEMSTEQLGLAEQRVIEVITMSTLETGRRMWSFFDSREIVTDAAMAAAGAAKTAAKNVATLVDEYNTAYAASVGDPADAALRTVSNAASTAVAAAASALTSADPEVVDARAAVTRATAADADASWRWTAAAAAAIHAAGNVGPLNGAIDATAVAIQAATDAGADPAADADVGTNATAAATAAATALHAHAASLLVAPTDPAAAADAQSVAVQWTTSIATPEGRFTAAATLVRARNVQALADAQTAAVQALAAADAVALVVVGQARMPPPDEHVYLIIDTGHKLIKDLKGIAASLEGDFTIHNIHSLLVYSDSCNKSKAGSEPKSNYEVTPLAGTTLQAVDWYCDHDDLQRIHQNNAVFLSQYNIVLNPADHGAHHQNVQQTWKLCCRPVNAQGHKLLKDLPGGWKQTGNLTNAHLDNNRTTVGAEFNKATTHEEANYALQRKRSGDHFQIYAAYHFPTLAVEEGASFTHNPFVKTGHAPPPLRPWNSNPHQIPELHEQYKWFKDRTYFVTGDLPAAIYSVMCGVNTILYNPSTHVCTRFKF